MTGCDTISYDSKAAIDRRKLKRDMELQREEIYKHKWIESEKAGRDLGDEAVHDWIVRYAAKWREEQG